MSLPQWIVLVAAALRVAELIYAARNSRRLLAAGGLEIGAGHYPLFVLLHSGWLIALFVLVPADAPTIRSRSRFSPSCWRVAPG